MSPFRGRKRRQDKREDSAAEPGRSAPQGPTRYRMREKLLTIGNDYVIETADGELAFKVDGKALRVRETIKIQDTAGQPLYTVQERKVRLKQTMVIEQNGQRVAMVQKAFVTPLRDRFDVRVEGGPPLQIKGNVLDHEYNITRGGAPVASVSKRWFRVRDIYGVEGTVSIPAHRDRKASVPVSRRRAARS